MPLKKTAPRLPLFVGAIVSVLLFTGCGGADTEQLFAEDPVPNPTPPSTLAEIQEAIFSPICVECHSGTSPPADLYLSSAEISFANLVDVEAANQPDNSDTPLLRVEPGNAAGSYLMHKIIEDDASRMPPPGRDPLSDEQIAMIRSWINAGAAENNDATAVVNTKMALASGSLQYTFQLTGEVDPGSVSPGSALIYFVAGDERVLGGAEHTELTVHGRTLVVSYRAAPPIVYDRIELQLNHPSYSALLDTKGRYVDVNGDGAPGGMLLHVYP